MYVCPCFLPYPSNPPLPPPNTHTNNQSHSEALRTPTPTPTPTNTTTDTLRAEFLALQRGVKRQLIALLQGRVRVYQLVLQRLSRIQLRLLGRMYVALCVCVRARKKKWCVCVFVCVCMHACTHTYVRENIITNPSQQQPSP